MTIEQWLDNAYEQLHRANITTARLDADLILCHMLGVDRTWLIAHADESLSRAALTNPKGVRPGGITVYGDKLVLRRLKREPMAYLMGEKEFYGRMFTVNKHVLIPRPETEAVIEPAKKHRLTGKILDVGCGSGAIGLTLTKELDQSEVTLSDISPDALDVAQKNAKRLKIKSVEFVESDLLEHWVDDGEAERFDAIVANLPYVDRSWERSPETAHEPRVALFAEEGGLELINQLIEQTPQVLRSTGYLLLEADPEQHPVIISRASEHGFSHVETEGYGVLLQKD